MAEAEAPAVDAGAPLHIIYCINHVLALKQVLFQSSFTYPWFDVGWKSTGADDAFEVLSDAGFDAEAVAAYEAFDTFSDVADDVRHDWSWRGVERLRRQPAHHALELPV